MGRKPTFSIYTLGCKVNSYETGAVSEALCDAGYERLDFGEKCDVCIINTCAVTEESGKKSLKYIRRAKRENPGCVLVVCGCFVQISEAETFPDAQIVIGNKNKSRIPEYIDRWLATGERITEILPQEKKGCFEPMRITSDEHTRAFVKVQDGCDNFCSYCVIPYARGRICSKPVDEACDELSGLLDRGYREIVITGIHLDSYGKDIGSLSLCDLLERADKLRGLERLRIGSLEPVFITSETVSRLKTLKNLCPQFHLSLQSGCDATLRRMNRHYTSADFERAANILREAFPCCALTTDVIVGFCGETEDEFKESCSFVEKTGFARIHVFPFSPRKGTRAYTMEGQVPDAVKTERAELMGKISRKAELLYNSGLIGKTAEIITERSGEDSCEGYTPTYVRVSASLSGKKPGVNETVRVRITDASSDGCTGEISV